MQAAMSSAGRVQVLLLFLVAAACGRGSADVRAEDVVGVYVAQAMRNGTLATATFKLSADGTFRIDAEDPNNGAEAYRKFLSIGTWRLEQQNGETVVAIMESTAVPGTPTWADAVAAFFYKIRQDSGRVVALSTSRLEFKRS